MLASIEIWPSCLREQNKIEKEQTILMTLFFSLVHSHLSTEFEKKKRNKWMKTFDLHHFFSSSSVSELKYSILSSHFFLSFFSVSSVLSVAQLINLFSRENLWWNKKGKTGNKFAFCCWTVARMKVRKRLLQFSEWDFVFNFFLFFVVFNVRKRMC